jgi:hypothetical protein
MIIGARKNVRDLTLESLAVLLNFHRIGLAFPEFLCEKTKNRSVVEGFEYIYGLTQSSTMFKTGCRR